MKIVRYTVQAARDLKRYGTMAERVRKAIAEYAEDAGAHANNLKALTGTTAFRLRVGDYRVIFDSGPDTITVTKVGPRSNVYD